MKRIAIAKLGFEPGKLFKGKTVFVTPPLIKLHADDDL